ncbi:PAS domain-containing protein [Pseudomonas asuensis]
MRTFHPFRLAGLYALIGIAWVGVTDYLLDHASLSTSTLSALQTVKGIVFVCGIAVLLYFHIRREQRARQQLIDELQRHVEQLQQTLGTTAQTTNEQPPLQPPIQTEAEAPHYQDILDHLPLVAFLIDLDGHWRFLSSAWERLTQKAISQTVGGSVFQCFHSQENQSIQQMLNEFRDGTRHDWSATLRLCQVDGSHRWISFKIHKVIDEGLQGTITDIHHQFQADELQRARNAVLDELLQGHTKSSILTGIAKRLEGIFPEMRVIIQLADGSRKAIRQRCAKLA